MLPPSHRLAAPLIRDITRSGKRVREGSLEMVIKRNTLDVSRFAVVVAVSFDKRATARNRARRLVRESLRILLPVLPRGWDAIFFIRKGLPDSEKEVEVLVRNLFASLI